MTTRKVDDADDQGRTGKGTGASGGGSFGNERGEPVTGGAPENGQRDVSDVGKSSHADREAGKDPGAKRGAASERHDR